MRKKDLVQKLAESSEISQALSEKVVKNLMKIIEEAFKNDEGIELRNFGNFIIKTRKARKTHNFQTGESIPIPARKTLLFKMSKYFGMGKRYV